MSTFEPRDDNFADRVREIFQRQKVMSLIGAELRRVEPGDVEIALPFRDELAQQHGFLRACGTPAVGTSACG